MPKIITLLVVLCGALCFTLNSVYAQQSVSQQSISKQTVSKQSISQAGEKQEFITISDSLEIIPLSKTTFVHISYQSNPDFGKFTCNGLIYINGNEALIMDTPPCDSLSEQLLHWLAVTFPKVKVKGVVVNHFHYDCLGGLEAFHKHNIPSYSFSATPSLAAHDHSVQPQHTFNKELTLKVGKKEVYCYYPGEAHSKDNIVTWIPAENILFGGCMVKAIGASRGNIADANLKEWSNTVQRVKTKFKTARIVVPGHGDYGGPQLLDYTIRLFAKDRASK